MFMEAILLSLKDLETTKSTEKEAGEQTSNVDSDPPKSKRENDQVRAVDSTTENGDVSNMEEPTSSSTLVQSTSVSNSKTDAPKLEKQTRAAKELSTSSSETSSSSSNTKSKEADLSANTKATLTVEKSPGTNVMDGLMRRWDFNFFRNNQSK